jgi:hypothetical protein
VSGPRAAALPEAEHYRFARGASVERSFEQRATEAVRLPGERQAIDEANREPQTAAVGGVTLGAVDTQPARELHRGGWTLRAPRRLHRSKPCDDPA